MYKTILVPIDLAHTNEAIDIAIAHGNKETKIILLNVVEEIPNWAAAELPSGIVAKSLQYSQSELEAIAKASTSELEVAVRTGHASKTILEVANEKSADLIIIASHKPGLQDYLLGSTASKVVRHAMCSVLVVR